MTLRFTEPVALLGGGDVSADALRLARARATALIAADGGANRFAPEDGQVSAIIGDLDSLHDRAVWASTLGERLIHIAEQDTTDLEKCLYTVDAPLYLGVGFFGGRIDHTLAAAHVLLKRAERKAILLSDEDAMFLAPRRWSAELEPGDRVSIAPLRPIRGLCSAGLRWPIDGLDLEMGAQIGTSNEAAAARVSLAFDRAGAAIILPRARLDAAIASLA